MPGVPISRIGIHLLQHHDGNVDGGRAAHLRAREAAPAHTDNGEGRTIERNLPA